MNLRYMHLNDRKNGISLKDPRIQYIIMGFIIAILPLLSSNGIIKNSNIILIGGVLIYAIAGLGLDLLLGYGGLISLGTAGFMGLAAYISAYLTVDMNLPFEISLIISIAIPVILGLLVGWASLKIEGIYLAIATLCVSEILRKTFEELTVFTNSFGGKKAAYPLLFGNFQLDRNQTFVLITVVLVILMIISYNIVNSKQGRALHAMRGSEVVAQAMGINILKYRLLVFALATGYTAIAGALYVHFINFSYPSTWGLPMSLNILALVVIGGMRSSYGMLIGSLVVFAVPDLVLKKLPIIGNINGIPYVFSGLLIIVIVLLYPQGLVHLLGDIKRFLIKMKGRVRQND